MIVKPRARRHDWFTWRDPPLEWYRPLADDPLPGLVFGAVGGKIIVDFHQTHLPCMPDDVRAIAEGYGLPAPPPLPTNLLRPYQLRVHQELGGFRGVLLAMEMRTGKAQPLTSKVLTPVGWRAMGELRVGDLIIGGDGKVCAIKGVYPRGQMETYRVEFSDGSSTVCTDDHFWSVNTPLRRWKGHAGRVQTLRDIRERLVDAAGNRQHFIPMVGPVEFSPICKLPLDPYLLGLLLGNGGFTSGGVRFSTADKETIERVAVLLPKGVEIVYRGAYDYTIRAVSRSVDNSVLLALRALGLLGHRSESKFVPEIYKRAAPEDRLALLQGLFDTDSYTDGHYIEYSSSSPWLADDVLFLVQSLGGVANRVLKKTACLPSYRMCVSMPEGMAPFRLHRRAEKYALKRKYMPARSIVSVQYCGIQPVQCIAVNNSDGLYVTDDFIVTHNTPLACHMHDPSFGPLIIAAPLAAREAWKDWVGRTFNWPLQCLSTFGTEADMPGLPAYFCHYEILAEHAPFLLRQGIGTLVLDEIHCLQGVHSKRVQAVSLLTAPAKKILGLSGTPMWNKPKSMWQLLHFLTPGAWGTAFEFKRRYCGAEPGSHGWTYEGITHPEELAARIGYMTARLTWKDVAPDLPPTTRVFEPVSLTGAQYAALEAAAMKATLARGTSNAAGYFANLRRKAGLLKIKPAVEAALRAVEDGHKVVLWAWHNEVLDKLQQALLDARRVGGWWTLRSVDSIAIREESVTAFREYEGPAFMVASIGVAGVGLDLSCSDHAIFVELDWTPAMLNQAEMRTFHISRPHSVTYFYTDDPIESKLIAALDAKNGFAKSLGLGSEDIMKEVLR